MRKLGKEHPSVTVIRVKDALDAFNAIFTKVMVAVRAAGGVTLLAGALVLAGALATAQRRRILEAVVLKVLGATRRRILTAHLIEYVLLASATALFAVGLGAVAAWFAVTQLMHIGFSFDWGAVVAGSCNRNRPRGAVRPARHLDGAFGPAGALSQGGLGLEKGLPGQALT